MSDTTERLSYIVENFFKAMFICSKIMWIILDLIIIVEPVRVVPSR